MVLAYKGEIWIFHESYITILAYVAWDLKGGHSMIWTAFKGGFLFVWCFTTCSN